MTGMGNGNTHLACIILIDYTVKVRFHLFLFVILAVEGHAQEQVENGASLHYYAFNDQPIPTTVCKAQGINELSTQMNIELRTTAIEALKTFEMKGGTNEVENVIETVLKPMENVKMSTLIMKLLSEYNNEVMEAQSVNGVIERIVNVLDNYAENVKETQRYLNEFQKELKKS